MSFIYMYMQLYLILFYYYNVKACALTCYENLSFSAIVYSQLLKMLVPLMNV